MDIDWFKVVEAACMVVNTYIVIAGSLNRSQYKEKVYDTIINGVFEGNNENLSLLTETLKQMDEHDIANDLERIAEDSDDRDVILESYIKSEKYFNDIIDQSYDSLGIKEP